MSSEEIESLEYKKPKILVLDCSSEISRRLDKEGFNISEGTLGTPNKVSKNNSLFPIDREYNLPYDYKEHEIVVTDLNLNDLSQKEIKVNESAKQGVKCWWANHSQGLVNPRILNGYFLKDDFDRIIRTGGVFIVFANVVHQQKFIYKNIQQYGSDDEKKLHNWSFLSLTSHYTGLRYGEDYGNSISLSADIESNPLLAKVFSEYLDQASYSCTISPSPQIKNNWFSLMENKFGDSVGAAIKEGEREGYLFVLPDIKNKAELVSELIHDVLPVIKPELFPGFELASWLNSPRYQLDTVKRLKDEIVEIKKETREKISELEEKIETIKNKNQYLFDLTTKSGDELVKAVEKALEELGFEQIIDVDEEIIEEEENSGLREDLRINDSEPILVTEVKGISGFPSDEDALTVQKYVVLRMREWDDTNVKGLSIINLQRNLPPLERENEKPFRNEILENADEQQIGLLTGWDLHRLVRNFKKHDWKPEQVKPLFYENGRINPIPVHYTHIGTVERYIEEKSVIGIEIKKGELSVGDTLAYELPLFFEEQVCESLEFENESIEKASSGMLVGVKTHLSKEQVNFGTNVYHVEVN